MCVTVTGSSEFIIPVINFTMTSTASDRFYPSAVSSVCFSIITMLRAGCFYIYFYLFKRIFVLHILHEYIFF